MSPRTRPCCSLSAMVLTSGPPTRSDSSVMSSFLSFSLRLRVSRASTRRSAATAGGARHRRVEVRGAWRTSRANENTRRGKRTGSGPSSTGGSTRAWETGTCRSARRARAARGRARAATASGASGASARRGACAERVDGRSSHRTTTYAIGATSSYGIDATVAREGTSTKRTPRHHRRRISATETWFGATTGFIVLSSATGPGRALMSTPCTKTFAGAWKRHS